MGYYSFTRKGEIMQFTATWIDLENTTLNEVSQKDRDRAKYLFQVWHIENAKD